MIYKSLKLFCVFCLFVFSLSSCEKAKEEEIFAGKPKYKLVDFGFNLHDFNVVNDTIQSGDTFGSLLENQNLKGQQVFDIVAKVKDTFDVRTIRIGKAYTILRTKDKTNKIQVFIYQPDRLNYYIVDFRDTIMAYKKTRPLTLKTRTIAGALNGSLSETLQNLDVDPSLATRIAKVYAWSIDFFKLQKGDKFGLTFSERYINDTIYDGVDSLKAAFFEYKGKNIYAFPFSPDGSTNKQQFFDEEGKTLKNFFLKAPLKFVNITSRYTRSRFHPVQKIWKAHNGTDYAAPTGTPIMTTAAGVVEQAGYTTGNGNFVKVKHDRTYSTQYLHMSKIVVRRGQRVTQGQVIGKVGSTGLATGPHVCYRFWKNGVQVDALRLKLPTSTPMDSKYKQKYLEYMKPLKRTLDSVGAINPKK
ncbi:MAG: peptidoglycan DD-metalloendopeptidase family protein [Flavobacterium sp.]|nr:peptidoglycan DD-metalloendopeptidase family protein [Flavobacterium sp.]